MRGHQKTATEQVIEKISKLKGPNKAQQGAMIWMANAFANQDVDLQGRSARIANQMQASLQKAFPEVDPQFIGHVVADLDSLWDTGQKLNKELEILFRMRFPRDRNRLAEFLSFVEATQIDMVEFWIGNLRKRIPKLRRALDRQGQNRQTRSRGSVPRRKARTAVAGGLTGNARSSGADAPGVG
jgi:hypothetical protein